MEEDGVSVEPTHYLPVIPTLLVNGSEGIGTGWSTYIPTYNPIDIVQYIQRKLKRSQQSGSESVTGTGTGTTSDSDSGRGKPLQPWFRGFTGRVVRSGSGSAENGFDTYGLVNVKQGREKEVLEVG